MLLERVTTLKYGFSKKVVLQSPLGLDKMSLGPLMGRTVGLSLLQWAENFPDPLQQSSRRLEARNKVAGGARDGSRDSLMSRKRLSIHHPHLENEAAFIVSVSAGSS